MRRRSRACSRKTMEKKQGQSRRARQTCRRPMPVRQGRLRDRRAGALGLARSFAGEPPRAWRGLCDLCRKLAQAFSHHQRQDRHHALRGQGDEDRAQLLRAAAARRLLYERARSPHMVNIPRALFSGRTGRQPLYHIAIEELQEWAYTGEPLVPLKGFPGVVWQRSKKKKRIGRRRSVRAAGRCEPATQGSHDRAPLRASCKFGHDALIPRVNEPAGWRKHEEQHHRPLRLPCAAEGRRHHASVRQSRHHRTADHARAEGPSRSHLCDGDAGEPGGRDGRRLQPRLGQARRLQRPCRARPRQRDGLALQRELHRHADDPDRRPAGAGPRPDGAGALWAAGADGRAAGEMGGRGDAAGGSAAHRAPRRQDRDHAADRAGVHLAARRHPQCRGRHRTRPLDPRRYPRQAVGRSAAGAGRAHPESGAAGDHHRRRDRQERCAARKPPQLAETLGCPAYQSSTPYGAHFLSESPCFMGALARIQKVGARGACALRSHDRARRRSAADVGLQRGRSAAGRACRSCRSAWSIGISPRTTAPRSR